MHLMMKNAYITNLEKYMIWQVHARLTNYPIFAFKAGS